MGRLLRPRVSAGMPGCASRTKPDGQWCPGLLGSAVMDDTGVDSKAVSRYYEMKRKRNGIEW
jgi:hypothetical protein